MFLLLIWAAAGCDQLIADADAALGKLIFLQTMQALTRRWSGAADER